MFSVSINERTTRKKYFSILSANLLLRILNYGYSNLMLSSSKFPAWGSSLPMCGCKELTWISAWKVFFFTSIEFFWRVRKSLGDSMGLDEFVENQRNIWEFFLSYLLWKFQSSWLSSLFCFNTTCMVFCLRWKYWNFFLSFSLVLFCSVEQSVVKVYYTDNRISSRLFWNVRHFIAHSRHSHLSASTENTRLKIDISNIKF